MTVNFSKKVGYHYMMTPTTDVYNASLFETYTSQNNEQHDALSVHVDLYVFVHRKWTVMVSCTP